MNLIDRVSEYVGIKKENIIMAKTMSARVVSDEEYDEIKTIIRKKGFRKFRNMVKEKEQKQMMEMLKKVECKENF